MPRFLAVPAALLALAFAAAPAQAQGLGNHLLQQLQRNAQNLTGNADACGRGQAEHRLDWLSHRASDTDPAGLPRSVGAVHSAGASADVFALAYGGLTRRFVFDRPEVRPAANLPIGYLEVGYDLLQHGEVVEVIMIAPRPVDRFTAVLGGIGTTLSSASGAKDAVWVEGIAPDGRRVAPAYAFPSRSPENSANLVRSLVAQHAFGAPWAMGPGGPRVDGADADPIAFSFTEPVVQVAFRFSGADADTGGWAHGDSADPPTQRVDIVHVAYCAAP